MLQLGHFDARRTRLDDKGAHACPPGGGVDGSPNDHEAVALAQRFMPGSDKDLLTVEHPFIPIAVEHGSGANSGGVRASLRLGHRHGAKGGLLLGKARQEFLLLLGRAGGFDRSRAQAAARRHQVQTDIAPGQRLEHEAKDW